MTRLSNYLLPSLKENPAEAKIVSHQLMLRAGMIRQVTSGIYNWLPLGLNVLRKVEQIVREEMNASGATELLMPTMQPADLWQESGRGSYAGKETLKAIDRHDNTLFYSPTNEELITDIFRRSVRSYKQLPLNLYHIQWKFRDEIRPRFGVMRGREFLMKDAYTFDVDEAAARDAYDRMYLTYLKIFRRMGLTAIPFRAETGEIGGDLSHEFQVLAQTGESEIFYDPDFETELAKDEPDIARLRSLYSAADEMHDPAKAPANVTQGRGIEVGHIFYLGTKYSETLGAKVMTKQGKESPAHMGCYGIGISRLLGAIIEAHHDDKGITWPEAVAPFRVGIVNVKTGHDACDSACDALYASLKAAGVDVLYDDRTESAGSKFADMELIGLPYVVAIGPRSIENGEAELKTRATGESITIKQDEITAQFAKRNESC